MLILSQTLSVSKRLHRKFSENKFNRLNLFFGKESVAFFLFNKKTKKA